MPYPKINALAVAGTRIWAGVYQAGIYESADQGATWNNLNYDLPNLKVQSILCLEDQRLLVGTDAGIYQLDRTHKQWQPVLKNLQILSLEQHKDLLVAGTNLGTVLSSDQGKTWSEAHKADAIHYTHMVEQSLVELFISGDLHISKDDGATWSDIYYAPRKDSYIYEIVALDNYWIMSNNYGIHQSTNKGKNWYLVYPTEEKAFFDLLVVDGVLYGAARTWDEYRGR
ncbi:MAG: WD40/YVTN/BNR-like repeat-containing protein [Aureispira sp.]